MRLDVADLDLPAAAGARLALGRLLREALAELDALEAGARGEALHDFRVALRRLRSLARALRPVAGRALSRRHERRLRAIAAATTARRDAEVQVAWLARQREVVPARERAALDALLRSLAGRRGGPDDGAGAGLRKLAARLERRLDADGDGGGRGAPAPSLGPTLAALLRDQADALSRALDRIAGPFDVERAHAARIAGKRLRYLLEPLRGNARADAAPAVAPLKELQELLGELHDAHVLGEVVAAELIAAAAERARLVHAAVRRGARGPALARLTARDARLHGLAALDARVADRAIAAWRAIRGRWLRLRRPALARAVAAVAGALSPGSAGPPPGGG